MARSKPVVVRRSPRKSRSSSSHSSRKRARTSPPKSPSQSPGYQSRLKAYWTQNAAKRAERGNVPYDHAFDTPHFIKIKHSTLPGAGEGAFAAQAIIKGERLGQYLGNLTDKPGDYVFDTKLPLGAGTLQLDGEDKATSNWTRYINTGTWEGVTTREPNIEFVHGVTDVPFEIDGEIIEMETAVIFIRALRDIEPGEELFLSYGAEY